MIYVDFAVRGGAITLLLLLATLLSRTPIGWESRASVSALAITESAFLITKTALPIGLPSLLDANLTFVASLTPAAVTWLIVNIFLDPPGRRGPWVVAALATSAALYFHELNPSQFRFCLLMAMALYGALFILSLWSTRDDLVECRCRARPGFAAAIAGLALFLTASEATGLFQAGSPLLALLQATGTLAVTIAFSIWLLRPDANLWPGHTPAEIQAPLPDKTDFTDPALTARIQAAMNAGIWREEGLTIGELATKLAVPEHRLRRAINQGLGYRNFSSFINRARIEAACAALTDPDQMNVTVLEIAYQVGFASVGPFNRAFRAEIGHSPTEYRRMTHATGASDCERSSLIPINLH